MRIRTTNQARQIRAGITRARRDWEKPVNNDDVLAWVTPEVLQLEQIAFMTARDRIWKRYNKRFANGGFIKAGLGDAPLFGRVSTPEYIIPWTAIKRLGPSFPFPKSNEKN